MGDRLAAALLGPLPNLGAALRLGPSSLVKFAARGLRTTAGWSQGYFQTEAARRVVPAMALHVDLGPRDIAGNGLGLVLTLLAATSGFQSRPVAGADTCPLQRFEEAGGKLQLNTHVERCGTPG